MKIAVFNSPWFRFLALSLLAFLLFAGNEANAQPGLLDMTFNAGTTNPTVYDVSVQPDGHVVVQYGWPVFGLGRFASDGSPDANFNPGLPPGAKVRSFDLQSDGRMVIAGTFLQVQGVSRPCVARLNVDGTLDESFVPQLMAANIPPPPPNWPPLPDSPTNSIGMVVVQGDGKVLVTSMSFIVATNGTSLPALIRLNSDGSIDTGFAAVTNAPHQVACQPDGKILIEQAITWNYPGSNIVFRLNQDGTRDNSFSLVGITGWANVLLPQTNSILLGGFLFRINGFNSGWMARVTPIGQLDSSFNGPSYDYGQGIMDAILQPDGKILIGGLFWKTNPGYRNLARLNSNGSVDSTYASTGTDSFIWALASQPDGKALVAGEFTAVNGVSVPPLVRLIGDSSVGPGTLVLDAPTAEVFENAGSIAVNVNRIWGNQGNITVNYRTVSGTALPGPDYVAQSGVIVFDDGETAATLTLIIADDTTIEDVESFQVLLSDASNGAQVGSRSNCVVKILDDDGPASLDPNFVVGSGTVDGAVHSVAVQPDGHLVVGGWFHQIAGVPRRGVARLNPDGSLDASFNPGSGLEYGGNAGWLNLVKLQTDGKVLMAGIFNRVNGTVENYLARLNPDGSVDTSFNDGSGPLGTGGVVGDVRGMELLADGKIIVGGGFNTLNGVPRNGLARLNTNGSVDVAYQPAGANVVDTFGLEADGKVVFSTFGAYQASRINADGTPNTIVFASANNYIRQISSLPNGITTVAGSFSSINGQPRRCLARLLSDGTVDTSFVPDVSLFVSTNSTPYIYRFTVQPDGKVVAALKTYVAPEGNYLVRFNTDGSLDTDFEPTRFAIPIGDNDTISTIAIQCDNSILVGGQFQTVNDLSRPYLVRLKGGARSGSRPLAVKSLSLTGPECGLSLAVSPGKPFVLQRSDDLLQWVDVTTNTVLVSRFTIVDRPPTPSGRCFYRVKQLVP